MNGYKVKSAYTDGTEWSKMDNEKRMGTIRAGLAYGIMMRGQNKLDDAIMQDVTNGVNDYLLEEYPSLRDKEFAYIVALGISGELGQETFVCGASLMRWVRIYCKSAERLAQVEEHRTQSNTASSEDEQERNAKVCYDAVHKAFEFFKKHHTIFGEERNEQGELVMQGITLVRWAGQIYDYYKKAGNITEPSEADKRVAQTRAEKAVSAHGTKGVGKRLVTDATFDDWYRAFLLEQYFASVLKVEIII